MAAVLTPWKLAMLPVLILFLWLWLHDDGPARGAKLRSWAALYGTSVLGWWMTPATGQTPYLLYIILCIAGAVWTLKEWKGVAQHAIGVLFWLMAAFHCGALMADASDPGPIYRWVLIGMGWAQLAILLAWGAIDAGLGKGLRILGHAGRRALHYLEHLLARKEGQP